MWKIVAQMRVGLGLGRWLLGSEHFLRKQEERNLNLQHTPPLKRKWKKKKRSGKAIHTYNLALWVAETGG